MGHSDLEMTEHYAPIAQVDTEKGHRTSGPVDNLEVMQEVSKEDYEKILF